MTEETAGYAEAAAKYNPIRQAQIAKDENTLSNPNCGCSKNEHVHKYWTDKFNEHWDGYTGKIIKAIPYENRTDEFMRILCEAHWHHAIKHLTQYDMCRHNEDDGYQCIAPKTKAPRSS